jgi:hypothetical protein
MQPVLADQIPCFKALITIHKMLVSGPDVVLAESLNELRFLDDCARTQGSANLGFGYAPLIGALVQYIKEKLEFHRLHPQFNGIFEYNEDLSLSKISDLNEGYQTITELMDLQGKLESFEQLVFDQGRVTGQNECRLSALATLIEESYGIYKFMTSMLSAMHLCVDSPDPLVPLVERYNQQFWDLKAFYQTASRVPYLVSLKEIPELPDVPPGFSDVAVNRSRAVNVPRMQVPIIEHPPSPKAPTPVLAPPPPPPMPEADLLGEEEIKTGSALSQLKGLQYGSITNTIQTVAVVDPNLQAAYEQLLAENAYLREQLGLAASHIAQQEQLHAQDQEIKAQLQNQIDLMKMREEEQRRVYEENLRIMQQRLSAMETMYQEFRKSHLDLLGKLSGDSEKEKAEKERLEREERERLEKERLEKERLEQLERERLERERLENERLEKERLERERLEQERLERERLEKERLEREESDLEAKLRLVAEKIEGAHNELSDRMQDAGKTYRFPQNIHSTIVDGTAAMTKAIGDLIKHAIATQKEIADADEQQDNGNGHEFYLKNSSWTNGLISAAETVADSTVLLVETANGTLHGEATLEQLAVASEQVAGATAQLRTAACVRAIKHSKAQPKLEESARAVSDANKALVKIVASTSAETQALNIPDSAPSMAAFNVLQMNKQGEIKVAKAKLALAREELAEMRNRKYALGGGDASAPFDLDEMNKKVEIKELEGRIDLLSREFDQLLTRKPAEEQSLSSSSDLFGFEDLPKAGGSPFTTVSKDDGDDSSPLLM